MEYKGFLVVLLVLGILGVEPAGAVEIESLNQVKSPDKLNLDDDAQYNFTRSIETSLNIFNHEKDIETNLNNGTGINGSVLNQTANITILNNVTSENQTVKNETSINETALTNSTDENETVFNETGNGTVENETNLNGTVLNNAAGVNETSSDNDTQDSSTKTHTLNTIENAGYALAAIAGCFAVGIAVAPEGITKTICIVGAVVCGVAAAACFVAHAIASWFDW